MIHRDREKEEKATTDRRRSGRWDSRGEIVSWERLNYRETYFKGQPFMLRVGEENARLNCRGDENSRAKWSKVEATWRAVVLGCRDRDGVFLKIYPGERFVQASSLDPPRCASI